MKKDRTEICKIISDMLDNPDEHGIYLTSTAYTRLEAYVEQQRREALGWMQAECCTTLDRGEDPRLSEVPEVLERMVKDLAA